MKLCAQLFAASLLLAVSAGAGYSASDPVSNAIRAEAARLLVRDEGLERENARLRVKLRREHRANRYHAGLVRQLRRANRERVTFGVSGVVAGFLCVHRFEGAWNAHTGNGYAGGLQMDGSFQRTYGGEFVRAIGPAYLWPPFVQVAVAMRAFYSGRGWHPWPNTARRCGLI